MQPICITLNRYYADIHDKFIYNQAPTLVTYSFFT